MLIFLHVEKITAEYNLYRISCKYFGKEVSSKHNITKRGINPKGATLENNNLTLTQNEEQNDRR